VNPVAKALWFIESHSASDIKLDDIASCAGVSRFHLLRAFGATTGRSIMRYVRARRLSEAARRLAAGADDILAVALEMGYGSHEAFTRAFREQFGVTPEAVRKQGHVDNLELVEAFSMNAVTLTRLDPPRWEQGKVLLLAGLSERIECENPGAIPQLWQRFVPYLGNVPGQIGKNAYGVIYNTDDAGNMDYMCGVEVSEFSSVPPEFARLRIPERRYAVFFHREHISSIRNTINTIWSQWLPESGHEVADAPTFELYSEKFDGLSGLGGVELWIPIKL
jgi:AraC family transcriptional regulator